MKTLSSRNFIILLLLINLTIAPTLSQAKKRQTKQIYSKQNPGPKKTSKKDKAPNAQTEILSTFNPADAGKYVLLKAPYFRDPKKSSGKLLCHLYNAQTGEIVIANFTRTSHNARLIKGDNRRMFFSPYRAANGFGRLTKKKNSPGFYVAQDYRRAIWFEQGDIWRADFDWFTREISNKKKVTSLGIFTTNYKLLLWSDNHLFIDGNFSKEKPIVRVNLYDGSVEELDWFNIINPGKNRKTYLWPQLINPDKTIGVRIMADTVDLIDLTNGRVVSIGNTRSGTDRYGNKATMAIMDLQSQKLLSTAKWYDNTTLFVLGFRYNKVISYTLDLARAKLTMLPVPNLEEDGVKYGPYSSRVPWSDAYFTQDASGKSAYRAAAFGELKKDGSDFLKTTRGRPGGQRLALVNYLTGETTLLPKHKRGKLISDNLFLYLVEGQGLSANGLWIWDKRTGKSVRISGRGQIDWRKVLYLHDADVIMFSRNIESTVYQVNADGSNLIELDKEKFLGISGLINKNPIDLGVEDSSQLAWRETTLKSALSTAPVDITGVARLELLKALEGESKQTKEFGIAALRTIRGNYTLANFYKHVPAALAIVAAGKREAIDGEYSMRIASLLPKANLKPCLDPVAINAYGRAQSKGLLQRRKFSTETIERMMAFVGDGLAESILKNTKNVVDIRLVDAEVSRLIKEALATERTRNQ